MASVGVRAIEQHRQDEASGRDDLHGRARQHHPLSWSVLSRMIADDAFVWRRSRNGHGKYEQGGNHDEPECPAPARPCEGSRLENAQAYVHPSERATPCPRVFFAVPIQVSVILRTYSDHTMQWVLIYEVRDGSDGGDAPSPSRLSHHRLSETDILRKICGSVGVGLRCPCGLILGMRPQCVFHPAHLVRVCEYAGQIDSVPKSFLWKKCGKKVISYA